MGCIRPHNSQDSLRLMTEAVRVYGQTELLLMQLGGLRDYTEVTGSAEPLCDPKVLSSDFERVESELLQLRHRIEGKKTVSGNAISDPGLKSVIDNLEKLREYQANLWTEARSISESRPHDACPRFGDLTSTWLGTKRVFDELVMQLAQ